MNKIHPIQKLKNIFTLLERIEKHPINKIIFSILENSLILRNNPHVFFSLIVKNTKFDRYSNTIDLEIAN